ncbi:MAG TPA: hypothetical protein PLG90_12095 [Ignavibacteria bacterium]|nr:hypothetical protein [Ignavibacteria bacterium]
MLPPFLKKVKKGKVNTGRCKINTLKNAKNLNASNDSKCLLINKLFLIEKLTVKLKKNNS